MAERNRNRRPLVSEKDFRGAGRALGALRFSRGCEDQPAIAGKRLRRVWPSSARAASPRDAWRSAWRSVGPVLSRQAIPTRVSWQGHRGHEPSTGGRPVPPLGKSASVCSNQYTFIEKSHLNLPAFTLLAWQAEKWVPGDRICGPRAAPLSQEGTSSGWCFPVFKSPLPSPPLLALTPAHCTASGFASAGFTFSIPRSTARIR